MKKLLSIGLLLSGLATLQIKGIHHKLTNKSNQIVDVTMWLHGESMLGLSAHNCLHKPIVSGFTSCCRREKQGLKPGESIEFNTKGCQLKKVSVKESAIIRAEIADKVAQLSSTISKKEKDSKIKAITKEINNKYTTSVNVRNASANIATKVGIGVGLAGATALTGGAVGAATTAAATAAATAAGAVTAAGAATAAGTVAGTVASGAIGKTFDETIKIGNIAGKEKVAYGSTAWEYSGVNNLKATNGVEEFK